MVLNGAWDGVGLCKCSFSPHLSCQRMVRWLAKLVYNSFSVTEEVLAGTEIPGGDDDEELMLNVLRCHLTY